jgi:hypothetical protein
MPTFFNYNKPAVDILRDLIYATNGFMLPATGVLYGTPLVVTPLVADPYQRDTVIEVSMDPSVPYQPWTGHRTVLYKRLSLANMVLPMGVTPIQVAALPTTTYAMLAVINAYFGLQLSEADVQNTTYTEANAFLLSAAPGSLAFEGSLDITTAVSVAGASPASDGISSTGSDGSSGSGSSGSSGSGSDGSSGSGSGSGSSGSGSGSSGSGSGSDGSGSGSGSSGAGTDGTDPVLGPDWEPDGESGAEAVGSTGTSTSSS